MIPAIRTSSNEFSNWMRCENIDLSDCSIEQISVDGGEHAIDDLLEIVVKFCLSLLAICTHAGLN